ncbi:peptidoglycan DD-metalloendopeptidase family protein [Ascidiimonas sp. W6]|uniref:peptidoglycan DD-metalloendopeptidase family protein n=1 Tax=Ascidiimonas meishanensis TaxID=3128903 RepID=UPI0030EDBB57
MSNSVIYLLETAIVFSILYLLYKYVLQTLTFHTANRTFLLLLIPVSLLLPLFDSFIPEFYTNNYSLPIFYQWIPSQKLETTSLNIKAENISIDFEFLGWMLYLIISAYFLMRIALIHLHLYKLQKKGTVLQTNGTTFISTDVSTVFSYLKWIFIPANTDKLPDTLVIQHERIHIRLMHSLDLILAEVYFAFFWWNPLVYFYKTSLKSVHEFQADSLVLSLKNEKSYYLKLLLENIGLERPNNLFHQFNHLIIKKRIDMIMKTKSSKKSVIRYFLIVPLVALLLMAFTKPLSSYEVTSSSQIDWTLKATPPSLFPLKNRLKKHITNSFGKEFKHPITKKKVVHGGIDIKAPMGTPIVATADGKITFSSFKKDWGNLIIINHSDGYETWYAHMQGFEVAKGASVEKGAIIGYVGSTGQSTGPHLHYEVRRNGKRLNPEDYYKK